jgi:hypothetical protein
MLAPIGVFTRTRSSDVYRVPFAAFHGLRHVRAAERRLDDVLDVLDRQAVARDCLAIDLDVGEVALSDPLSVDAPRAGHLPQDAFDLLADSLDDVEVCPDNLDANRRLDAGRQHVQPITDWLRPDVREPGELQPGVHLRLELLERHPRPPLVARLQLDDGVHHAHRRVVGRRRAATDRAEDLRHLRNVPQQLVLHLQQTRRLGDGHAGRRRRHVQHRAFVERRHEFTAHDEDQRHR